MCRAQKPHATTTGPFALLCARVSDRVVASLCRSSVVHRRLQVGLTRDLILHASELGETAVRTRHNAQTRTRLLSPITRSEAQQ
jgi:hypothetical protein